jgi:hypothetical protein
VVPRVSISGSADAFDRAAGAADQNCQGARAAVAVAGPDSWRHLAYGPVRRSAASVRKTARRTLGYGRAMTFTPEDKAESYNSTVSAPVAPSGTSNETTAVMELPGLIRTLDAPAQNGRHPVRDEVTVSDPQPLVVGEGRLRSVSDLLDGQMDVDVRALGGLLYGRVAWVVSRLRCVDGGDNESESAVAYFLVQARQWRL